VRCGPQEFDSEDFADRPYWSPWQNGHIESFFGKLRDELLNMEFYNNRRPHSA
jgi:transposase InsO family protein